MGKRGARSWGPMGWPVPGWRTGGRGVLRSAWMLYHLVGMSFSSSRYFVRFRSGVAAIFGLRVKSAPTIQVRRRGCQTRGRALDGGRAPRYVLRVVILELVEDS